MINDFDKRQLNIMLDKINMFKNKQLEFNFLIEDLNALLNVLQTIDKDWKKKFKKNWNALEEVYSFILYEKRSSLNQEDIKITATSIGEIEKLIKQYL